jgi:hypothetical protein
MRRYLFWILLVIALGFGFFITWVDSRPTWDDTGITAGAIVLTTGLLGLAMPRYAWLWALAVGLWIPGIGLLLHHDPTALLILIIPFAGAYVGALGNKLLGALAHAGT